MDGQNHKFPTANFSSVPSSQCLFSPPTGLGRLEGAGGGAVAGEAQTVIERDNRQRPECQAQVSRSLLILLVWYQD